VTLIGGNYILDENGEPVLCPNLFEWGAWFESHDRTIAYTEVKGLCVSTVFLGLDHNFFDGGAPLLFETMIFPLTDDGAVDCRSALDFQERYATRAEAIAGHTRAVDWVLAGQ
jgi:hypothetical protein